MVVGSNPTGPTLSHLPMDIPKLLADAAGSVRRALEAQADWTLTHARQGQYGADLTANDAALEVLLQAGVGVLSEETGLHDADRQIVVVLDPVDGSTNASVGLPWFSVSLCAVGRNGLLAAHVENLVSGLAFTASAGERSCVWQRDYSSAKAAKAEAEAGNSSPRRQSKPIQPSEVTSLSESLLGVSGYPSQHLGWKQYRSLGSAALDLCLVASGSLDAFADVTQGELAPWDYLGGVFICQQAGAHVADANGAELVVLDDQERRRPVAAGTSELLAAVCERLV